MHGQQDVEGYTPDAIDQHPNPSSLPFGKSGVSMQQIAHAPHQWKAQQDGTSLKQSVLLYNFIIVIIY